VTDDSTSSHFQEWVGARDVIQDVDTNLDSIRKLGISLVSALLTADAVLLPGNAGAAVALPIPIKFAVLLVTLILLAATAIIDRNYHVLQQAAATRALVLERELNLELTEVISLRYASQDVNLIFRAIYILLGVALLVLGYFVLSLSIWLLFLAVGVVIYAVATSKISVDVDKYGGVDWSLDRTEVGPGDVFHLTATNLYSRPADLSWHRLLGRSQAAKAKKRYEEEYTLLLAPGEVYWKLNRDDVIGDGESVRTGTVPRPVRLGPQETFVWAIQTRGVSASSVLSVLTTRPPEGARQSPKWTYREYPLQRRILVSRPPDSGN